MKAYVCDACGSVLEDPYSVNMKEFYVGCDFDLFVGGPIGATRRVKMHLCEDCFHGLKLIAEKARRANDA